MEMFDNRFEVRLKSLIEGLSDTGLDRSERSKAEMKKETATLEFKRKITWVG
jgi:hypothetical protein